MDSGVWAVAAKARPGARMPRTNVQPLAAIGRSLDSFELGDQIMTLAVPPHLEPLVLERVRSGVYPSAEEVLELALRLLVWAESDPAGKRQILRLAIQAGIEDSEAGNVVPGDEVARRMRKRVRGEDP